MVLVKGITLLRLGDLCHHGYSDKHLVMVMIAVIKEASSEVLGTFLVLVTIINTWSRVGNDCGQSSLPCLRFVILSIQSILLV